MYLLNTFAYKSVSDKALTSISNNAGKKSRIKSSLDPMNVKLRTPRYGTHYNISRDIVNNVAKGNSINASKSKAFKEADNAINASKNYIKDLQKQSKQIANEVNYTKSKWSKTKLLTGKKLGKVGGAIIATGVIGASINSLRKSRKDKGKLRGKYK